MPFSAEPLACPWCGLVFLATSGEAADVYRGWLDVDVICPNKHYQAQEEE
jgi:hypothetical protein